MVINETTQIMTQLLSKVTTLSAVFQAIGGAVLIYIIFNIIGLFWNKKKNEELKKIRQLLEKINKKLNYPGNVNKLRKR